jgi:hypothetical protein
VFFEDLIKHDYNKIFERVKWYLNHQYKIEYFIADKDNYEVVVELMYYCIEGIHVALDTCLDDKKPDLTIRSLERDKHIVLTRAENRNLYDQHAILFY